MLEGLKKLLSSRKAWAMGVAAASAIVLQAMHLIAIWQGLAPEKTHAIEAAVNLLSGLALAGGGWLSLLIAGESAARDFGVTEPGPEESAIRARALAEVAALVPPELRSAIMATGPQTQPAPGRPVS